MKQNYELWNFELKLSDNAEIPANISVTGRYVLLKTEKPTD